MGQEISQQNKGNITCSRRQHEQPNLKTPQQQQINSKQQQQQQQGYPNYKNDKYTKHKDLIYTPSNLSTSSSSTDDAPYRQRQKYNLTKQTYEKSKVAKKYSLISNTTTTSSNSATTSSSDYQNTSIGSNSTNADLLYAKDIYRDLQQQQHRRKNSQSTDSGIHYSTCHCTSISSKSALSSAASTTSGFSSSLVSQRSNKSLHKQKEYLDHHLYIKSYLDILEEDEKARAHFQSARPGGIRNYTPKILADSVSVLSTSAPAARSTGALKSKDDPWI